jgi:hypothetical protein
MCGGFRALQARSAAEQNRPMRRCVHAKGVCALAVFEVLDLRTGRDPTLAARLAQGIYARPGRYPATVRFSNSDPGVSDDRRPDLRGLAFCVECRSAHEGADLAPGRQDYSLHSAPTLAFNDVHALAVFAKVFGAPSQAVALGALPLREQLLFARLTLLPRSRLDAEACEAVCIDVASHCTADSAPEGGVNRARSHAVAASRLARLGVTAAPAASERWNR